MCMVQSLSKFSKYNQITMASVSSLSYVFSGPYSPATAIRKVPGFRFEIFFAKIAPPFLGFQTGELSMWNIRRSVKIRWEIGFDSGNEEPLQISWNRKIRNSLYAFITKSKGFSQSNWWFRQLVINWDISWLRLKLWYALKLVPNLTKFKLQISCHYPNLANNADTIRISQDL